MVIVNSIFFIDTTFIFQNIHDSFFGTPLLITNEKDNTFAFGFLRNFLRIRKSLGITNGVLAIGKEAHSYTSKENIQNAITLLQKLNVPHINEPSKRVLDMGFALQSGVVYFVTQDKQFLQLATENTIVILFTDQKNYICISGNEVKQEIGVDKEFIASYLAMTKGPKPSRFTKRQAIRLIELYGDLNEIYDNLPNISSTEIVRKLTSNKERLFVAYQASMFSKSSKIHSFGPDEHLLNLATACKEEVLRSYGCYSLVRMLESPDSINIELTRNKGELNDYKAVTDRNQLDALVALVIDADICAVDTESDDKDPHQATLLGVSFSVSRGKAFFIPLTEPDLKDISRTDVINALIKIFRSKTRFVGHNIKYDYLLLRRNGIEIKTILFDTMLAAFECYSDWDFFNLGHLSKKLIGKRIKQYKDIVKKNQTFLDLPFREIVQHGCQDVDITLKLYHVLKRELNNRNLTGQYEHDSLLILKSLAEFEYKGILVKLTKLENIRKLQQRETLEIRTAIYDQTGKQFDIDCTKDLSAVFNDELNLREFVRKKISLSLLEQLAINNPIVQLIVKYKRSRKSLRLIESILKSVRDSRIFPVFNQVSSSYGQLFSKKPNIFEYNGAHDIGDCFDEFFELYFRSKSRSMAIIEDISNDHNLKKDRCSNWNELKKLEPLFENIIPEEFILSVVSGQSDFKLSQVFLIDHLTISTAKHNIEKRYSILFDWHDNFCNNTAKLGYAEIKGKRKYIDGIGSSNIEKKRKALNLAVRWVIQY